MNAHIQAKTCVGLAVRADIAEKRALFVDKPCGKYGADGIRADERADYTVRDANAFVLGYIAPNA